jgi:uncharacterized membrane protein YidH (DUF202 family)
MKKTYYTFVSASLLLPSLVSAQLADNTTGDAGPFSDLLSNILAFTNTVLIPFIIGIGFLVFVFGMFRYFIAGGANDEKKEQGRSLMIYATLGFVLIIIFWGAVNLIASSTGLDKGPAPGVKGKGAIPNTTLP